MAVNLSPVGGVAAQFFTNAGVPLSGGKIYTYTAGTSTPQATFTNSSGSIQHSNPIVLDAAGRVPSGEIWLTDSVAYKFIIKDSNDVLIGTYDNIIGINSNFVNYVNKQEIQTATAGQTVFNLTTMEYQPGTGNLSVFVDGVNQYGPGAQYAYTETDSNTVTFVSGLHVDASVKFTSTQIQNAYVTDATQVEYIPPFANSVATNVSDKLSQYVSVIDFGADPTGTADSTAAINDALSAYGNVYFPPGTYLTTGNHTITNQTVIGAGKAVTIIKRSSGTNDVFSLMDDGAIQDLTVDGNSTWGNGINVSTTTYGQFKPSVINTVAVKNVGATATPFSITGITNAAQCQITAAGHGLVAGDFVNIRNVNGLFATGNPTKSVVSGIWKVQTATSTTFTIDLDTTSWTSYVSGGQVLRTSCGICVERIGSGGYGDTKTLNNLELRNNDNHIYIGVGRYTSFNNVNMFGSNSRAAIYCQFIDSVWFNNTFAEGAIETFYYGVRDFTFNNTFINIQPANTYTGTLFKSIGMNYGDGTLGGEVANLSLNGFTVYRAKNFGTQPVFEINPYNSSFNDIHIYDYTSSATWYVFALYGIVQWSLKNVTIEGTYAWDLFSSTQNSGYAIQAENINYTQGFQGTATWSNTYPGSGDANTHTTVRGSNLNQKVKAGGCYGFWFENIQGNVDLTNVNQGGTFIYNVSGTVTDPNKAVSFRIDTSLGIWLQPYYTYADNAAAIAGGLTVNQVYKTSTGHLMVVY